MRYLNSVLVALLLAAPAVLSAQAPVQQPPASQATQVIHLHDYPGGADYEGQAQMPKTLSGQTHWDNPDVPEIQNPDMSQHDHVEFNNCPIYGELAASFVCGLTIKLYHTAAEIKSLYKFLISKIIWDDTGTEEMPVMKGNPSMGPDGVKSWHALITIDPTDPLQSRKFATEHGWTGFEVAVPVAYPNGDVTNTGHYVPIFSMVDPFAPETLGYPWWGASSKVDRSHSGVEYGDTLIRNGDVDYPADSLFFPVKPISKPWKLFVGTNGYGNNDLPPAKWEMRRDLDFHNSNPGVLMHTIEHQGAIVSPVVLDPAEMGVGTHRIAQMRYQADGEEQVTTLLVADVTVVGNIPPPPSTVTVPNVIGQDQGSAFAAIMALGLAHSATLATSSMVAAGNVISQLPTAGAQVAAGSSVALVVSSGPPPPQLCTDPTASNVGQPLPCVFPLPTVFIPTQLFVITCPGHPVGQPVACVLVVR